MFYQTNYLQENQIRQLINMVPGYGDATNSIMNQACTGLNQKVDSESLVSSDTSTKNELSSVSFLLTLVSLSFKY
jgi:hypothetical protein